MDDESNILLMDTHTKCYRRYYNMYFIPQKGTVNLLTGRGRHASMIISSNYPLFFEVCVAIEGLTHFFCLVDIMV
jgi:hypothetical protein